MDRWIRVKKIYTSKKSASSLIKILENKFPEVSFKLGKCYFDGCLSLGIADKVIPIHALLPSPHPNEISQSVYSYAKSLKWDSSSSEWRQN